MFEVVRSLGMDALFELGMKSVASSSGVVPSGAEVWGINSRRFNTSKLQVRSNGGPTVLGTGSSRSTETPIAICAR